MADAFDAALGLVLRSEGGKVDDAQDPGGRTNKGITQRVFSAWLASQGRPDRDVFTITDDEVSAIYKRQYADAVHFDELPVGVGYVVFDEAVNSGPGRAVKWLQAAVGEAQDGALGVLTLAAVNAAKPVDVINRMCDARLGFMRHLPTWAHFGLGWTRRVAAVRAAALQLATPPNPVHEMLR